ncbi:hypothetical protein, partial [Flavonifractor plautii]|uniref:hypothetical protein n=1 Tax=Flavonifractor plautii TaxID=292800 RepID=UPI001A9B356F
IDGPFDRWTAQFFLEIRQDSCEKIACQRPQIPPPGTSPIFKQALGGTEPDLTNWQYGYLF